MPLIEVSDDELLAVIKRRATQISDYANTTETVVNLKLTMKKLAELEALVEAIPVPVKVPEDTGASQL